MSERTKPMTVNDLIAALRKLDGNLLVYIDCTDSFYSDPLSADQLEVGKIAFDAGGDYNSKITGSAYTIQPGYTSNIENSSGEEVECLKIVVR